MTTLAPRADIAGFAAAVRAHLDDLPADEVDELLDGLHADLVDQATEAGDAFVLPDPAVYAAELRTAAGLPEREPAAGSRSIAERVGEARARLTRAVDASPVTSHALDFVRALAPLWWVARGGLLFGAGAVATNVVGLWTPLLPTGLVSWVVLLALVFVSIQWGRGRWRPGGFLRVLAVVADAVAVIAAIVVLVNAPAVWDRIQGQPTIVEGEAFPGLSLDGERVRNVFAYDREGDPIAQVQLFDQSGRALTTVSRQSASEEWDYFFFGGGGPSPAALVEPGRAPVWNVFPLRELPSFSWGAGAEPRVEDAVAPSFPFPRVPALPTSDSTDGDPASTSPLPVETPAP